jgi:hypothetical protein
MEQIETVAPILAEMARSEKFLMHNEPEWFETWPEIFITQDWRCHDKSMLTVDADGALRYCVDIALPETIFMWELEQPEKLERYVELLQQSTPCTGCAWDPAYESIKRATDTMGIEKGRESFRHEMTEDRIEKLIPAAQKYFRR